MQYFVCDHEFANGTPARVDRETGTVELAPSFFRKTKDEQKFILLHELGHYQMQTKSEEEADIYAAESLSREIGFRRTADAANGSMHDTPRNDMRRIKIFNYLASKDRAKGNNIMDIDTKDMVYTDDGRMVVMSGGFVNDDGFRYVNNIISQGDISSLELTDYMNFCKYYNLPLSADAVITFRRRKQEDLDRYSNMSEERAAALATKERALQMLERGQITQKEYDNMVANIDTRSGFQKLIQDGPKSIGNAISSILGNSGSVEKSQSSTGSSMLPVAIILIAVAVVVIFFAMKK